jgi:threonine aldolase
MIFIKVKKEDLLKKYLKENGILVGGSYNKLRLVCHRDISQEEIDKTIEVFKAF